MRLGRAFYRMPVQFDAARLAAEVAALPESAWHPHPNHIPGNSCVRLISVDGGENDDVDGNMAPTPHLERMPYTRQLLASFGVVWSRSRLMRLAPAAGVPEHADINHHWFFRVRMHVPIETTPDVRFHCGGESVHMAAGEAWLFDNWRLHRVEHPGGDPRIHLVADTSGSAGFWQFAASGTIAGTPQSTLPFDPQSTRAPMVERAPLSGLMPPAELDLLVLDLLSELTAAPGTRDHEARSAAYAELLTALRYEWRQLHALHGDAGAGHEDFTNLRQAIRERSQSLGAGLVMRTNRVAAHVVLEGRVLRALLRAPRAAVPATVSSARLEMPAATTAASARVTDTSPIIILSAPRSGSTLLFETLAASQQVATLGGESHEVIEGIEALRPGAPGVESNRLDATQATPDIVTQLRERFRTRLIDAAGRPAAGRADLRLLEKTPKNALRVPFLAEVFPDAKYLLLWRDPREAIHSIVRAWEAGRWKTYAGLPGFAGPWSLLLPPGWRELAGRSLPEIAAMQWTLANDIALADLTALPRERWLALEYASLVADPAGTVHRICEFTGLDPDDPGLRARLAAPLPLSRQTLTAPRPDKWRDLAAEIGAVLPIVQPTWDRLRALAPRAEG
jgi:hypothetical protein